MRNRSSEAQGLSVALRLFIHYMGDIHQPMHCLSRYTKDEFPKGDGGGNYFMVLNHYDAAELHAVWDEDIYNYHASLKRPFDDDGWAALEELSTALDSSVSLTGGEVLLSDFNSIATESNERGSKVAYKGIKSSASTPLPDSYLKSVTPVASKQMVLAGHRLAHQIVEIFSSSEMIQDS
eukprot:CAMPEP_0170487786 /NCGR_PEP_ID=MMETSP0208-20121228/6524_1 /TAXON_ID=197538 /ORGANISM="Strombidium inclinatum, Strain S3" /LENGTH=178 /DNA_ID=CAMNT_0010762181 /DNA_START=375 /DNA_END=907 /DNA_ORIENTATION=+